jgi:menaquinone-dependent protoporphyrinogen oxidase
MKKVLVAYGTKTGSTKEVAEKIGKVFASSGIQADVLPLSQTKNLSGYSGFVIGAPVNGMRWFPEALAFISDNQAALKAKPSAFFLLSVVMSGGRPSLRKRIVDCFSPASALVSPVSVATFGGRMDADPPLILRLVFGLKKDCPRDGRNWEAIESWAKEVAGKF